MVAMISGGTSFMLSTMKVAILWSGRSTGGFGAIGSASFSIHASTEERPSASAFACSTVACPSDSFMVKLMVAALFSA
jgi:hypothetical protein